MAISHPFVSLELACGTPPKPRLQTLSSIGTLRRSRQATMQEATELIERESLYGLGCGLVDIVLLASTLITPATKLWTLDKNLAELAERFSVAFTEPLRY
jgi:hypothetical protein